MGYVLSWNNKPAELPAPPSLANDDGALPTDLLHEILLRLPASDLCRLRLVCRSWRSLTSDPGFAKAHASRHPLVVCIHDDDGRDLEVRLVDMISGNIIRRVPLEHYSKELSTQLDLVCVTPYWYGEPCSVLNLNLTTGGEATITTLPDSTRIYKSDRSILGYVPCTGEYKVLRTHFFTTRDQSMVMYYVGQMCDVMTLGAAAAAGGWRWRARPWPPVPVSLQSGHVVVVDGVAYFLLCRDYINKNPTEVKPDMVASFDMAIEEWRHEMLRGPVDSHPVAVDKTLKYNLTYNNLELAVLDGCLVMVQHGFRECTIDLWLLEDMDKGLWAKRCSARYAPSPRHVHNSFFPPYPLVLLEDGKIVMWVASKQVLRVYDPTGRTWADLTKLEHCSGANMYTGNLLSTHKVCRVDQSRASSTITNLLPAFIPQRFERYLQ